jgi:plastocyanin
MRRRMFVVATALVAVAAAGCSSSSTAGGGSVSPAAGGTQPVTIQLTEFQIIMPAQIAPGVQTLHIENIGGMPHFMDIMSIADGKSNDDIDALLHDPKSANGPGPDWLTPSNVPQIALHSSGSSSDVTLSLDPGRYAAFCWMPDAKGQPHAMDGMHTVFDVTGTPSTATMPTPEITLTWDGSVLTGVPATLPAGPHTFGLVNAGTKGAQYNFVQALEDADIGQLKQDANTWFGNLYAGDPPVRFLGGVSLPSPGDGVQAVFSAELTDGQYFVAPKGDATPSAITVGAGGIPSPSATAQATSCTPSGTQLSIEVSGLAFDAGCLAAPADTAFTIAFDNQDASVPHNLAIYPEGDGTKAIFTGTLVTGVATQTYNVDALPAGTYRFQCDVHPTTMNGTFIVG